MSDYECDAVEWGCDGHAYTEKDPFVQVRQIRPSDRSDMCCIMWGHLSCMGGEVSVGESGGVGTPEQWLDWIESPEAWKAGFLFLT